MEQKIFEGKYLGKLDLEDEQGLKKRLGKGDNLTHISLFTGIGGFDIGFAQAGIKTKVMVEFDKYCCKTLRANFYWEELKKRTKDDGNLQWKYKSQMKKSINWYHEPEPVIIQKDIKEVTTKEILEAGKLEVGECSILSGGFPCQGFSLAGRRVIEDSRNALYKQFVRIVDEAKPAMIIGENVPGIVSMAKGQVMQQICEDFANCGYDVTWDILDAANYGVPQHRKRVILIGKRVDLMRVREDGSIAMHIAAQKGEVNHPYLFYERLKRWNTKESEELLKKIEDDPMSKFMSKK